MRRSNIHQYPPWVSTGRVGYPQPGLKSGVVDPSNHHKTEWNWKGHSLSILAWVTSSQHSRIKQHGTALSGQAPLKNIPAANRIKTQVPYPVNDVGSFWHVSSGLRASCQTSSNETPKPSRSFRHPWWRCRSLISKKMKQRIGQVGLVVLKQAGRQNLARGN